MFADPTPSVAFASSHLSNSVVELRVRGSHSYGVLNRDELLARLNAKVEAKEIRNVDIAKALGLPDSRIPALLRGERRIFYDEAVKLVEKFELEQAPLAQPLPPAVLRLVARHISSALDLSLEPDEPAMQELLADLQAFSRFVADPQVRASIESAEAFFRAMQLRRPTTSPANQPRTDPQPAR